MTHLNDITTDTNVSTRSKGSHLTIDDRVKISVLKELEYSNRMIAQYIGVAAMGPLIVRLSEEWSPKCPNSRITVRLTATTRSTMTLIRLKNVMKKAGLTVAEHQLSSIIS